jgi:hypothetical protein
MGLKDGREIGEIARGVPNGEESGHVNILIIHRGGTEKHHKKNKVTH